MRPALAVALLGLALAAAPARAEEARPDTITLTGRGTVNAAPDRATITLGVVSEADTARGAIDAASANVAKVLAALDKQGIAKADIATSAVSVEPRYASPASGGEGVMRIGGFAARNELTVTFRDVAKLGGVLDAAITAGANQIGNIAFDVSDASVRLDAARKAAVADARRKAEAYAAAAGLKLGRVLEISEAGGGTPGPIPYRMAAAEKSVPIAAGDQELAVEARLVFEVQR